MRPGLLGYGLFALDVLAVLGSGLVARWPLAGGPPGLDAAGASLGALAGGAGGRFGGAAAGRLWLSADAPPRWLRSIGLRRFAGGGGGGLLALLILSGVPQAALAPWMILWVAVAAGLLTGARVGVVLRITHLMRTGRLEHRIVLVGGGEASRP